MKNKLNIKNGKIIFYILNTSICLYSIVIFVITDGKDWFSELLFQLLFVIDAIIFYLNRKRKE